MADGGVPLCRVRVRPATLQARACQATGPTSQTSTEPLGEAILAHVDDDPDQLLTGTGADRPVVAVRVRTCVGRPGGSAQARWRQERAGGWAAWTRGLPWRVALILGAGAGGGVLGSLLAPRLGLVLGGLAAGVAGWGLRFRPSTDGG